MRPGWAQRPLSRHPWESLIYTRASTVYERGLNKYETHEAHTHIRLDFKHLEEVTPHKTQADVAPRGRGTSRRQGIAIGGQGSQGGQGAATRNNPVKLIQETG